MVEVHAAVHHNFFAGSKRPALMDVTAMKPFGVNKTRAIGENGVEDASAGTRLDHAALVDARMNGRILPGMQRIQSNEIRSILIGLRNVAEQVPDGSNSTRAEQRRAAGTDALDELDLGVEAKHGSATCSRSAAPSPADRL